MKNLSKLWHFLNGIALVVMIATLGFQLFAYDAMRHIILCGVVILICGIQMFLDLTMKDKKSFESEIIVCAVWLVSLLVAVPRL